MTDWIITAGSAGVVLLMIGIAFALGFRGAAKLDDARLADLAASEGAEIEQALIGADGRAALARLKGDRLMIARVMGADVSVRILPASAAKLRLRQGRLSVTFGDLGYPSLDMQVEDSPAWLAGLCEGSRP